MLFICCLPVAYTCVWLEPSWHCGPFRWADARVSFFSSPFFSHFFSPPRLFYSLLLSFFLSPFPPCATFLIQPFLLLPLFSLDPLCCSEYERVYHILTKYIESKLPASINKVVDYLTSPGTIIPVLLLLTLCIYYLSSRVAQLNEANADLKGQLRKEKDSLNPEMMKNPDTPGNGLVALAEKKHVRIQEELTLSKPELQLPDDGSTTDNSWSTVQGTLFSPRATLSLLLCELNSLSKKKTFRPWAL